MKLLPRAGQVVLGTAAKAAGPLGLAYAGYDLLDATVEAATGKNLQETGVAAEETKDRLRSEGASEYDLRRRARTGRM